MRRIQVKKIAFSSTGSVYGEAEVIPTPETCPFPIQTSLYGASKVAWEGLIQAYCEGFGLEGYIFRFVSILGERYTHGHVFDFYLVNCVQRPIASASWATEPSGRAIFMFRIACRRSCK